MRSLKEIMAGLPWARRCVIERRADELAQLDAMTEPLGLIELPAQCDCPQRDVGIHGYLCPTVIKFLRREKKLMDHDARDRADYEEMHRDDVRWENLMERERALEVENAELRASLETAVGANAMWKRLYDELRAVIDSRDKAAGFEPLRSETAESKEVCTVAHDDCVLGVGEPNFCPYCEIERLINESEEMRKVRLMLYAERDYARQAARNADAKLAEAERLLDEASPRQECDGCGREFRWHQMFVEEGDRWECAECWDRCEKAERAAMRDRHDDK